MNTSDWGNMYKGEGRNTTVSRRKLGRALGWGKQNITIMTFIYKAKLNCDND